MKTIFLSSNTKIVTYCGQNITVNDKLNLEDIYLINKDGKPVKIHNINKCSKDAVQVIPNKGIPFICGTSTKINVKRYTKSKNNSMYQTLSLDQITQLEATLNVFHKCVKIIRCINLNFKESKLMIHPYIHGLFNSKETCTIQSSDLDIMNKIDMLGKQNDSTHSFWIDKQSKFIHSHNGWLTKELKRKNNIFHHEHEKIIPIEYIQTTNENIKEYLAGLIDGNIGNLKSKNHTFDITSRSHPFIDSLSIMFRACGFLVHVKETKFTRFSSKRQKMQPILRLYASGELTSLPSMKCKKINPGRKSTRDWTITFFSLGFHENIEGFEIEIDDDETILTEDFFILS